MTWWSLKMISNSSHLIKGAPHERSLLKKHPELEGILNKLVGKITAEQMSQMNYQVGVEGKSANQVARDFGKRKGY